MKKIVPILFVTMMFSGCYTLDHVVGTGGTGEEVQEVRQWYVLFGGVPINEVDTSEMVRESENYTVTTEVTVLDAIISIFTGVVTVFPRTVRVSK